MTNISIIIPAFNAADYLRQTVESLLEQKADGIEIIVVDDGSTDSTPAIAASFGDRIVSLRQDNQGVSAARNHGLRVARGRAVVFLDADDLSPAGTLQAFTEAFDATAGRCVLYGDVQVIDSKGAFVRVAHRPQLDGPCPHAALFLFDNGAIPPGAFLVPRPLLDDVGAFNAGFGHTADLDLWLRCGARAEYVGLQHTVLHYRVHATNMSSNDYMMMRENVDVRVAFQAWCNERGYRVLPRAWTETDLIEKYATDYFYRRRWRTFDALLRIARERHLQSPALRKLSWYRRLPEWLFRLRDRR